jgi:hypothetical protein
MVSTENLWKLDGMQQFPLIAPIATRLAVLAVQSADVERSCKVHKIIHTKSRNRLQNKTVRNLIFDYVNLRLLSRVKNEEEAKASMAVSDFLSNAFDDNAEEDNTSDDEVTEVDENGAPVTFDVIDEEDDAILS